MLKDFLFKRMLKSQGVSDEQAATVLELFQRKPELFQKIADEVKQRVAGGQNQASAALDVILQYQDELKQAVGS